MATTKKTPSIRTATGALSPLLTTKPRTPVDWLFVFKFNTDEEPGDRKDFEMTGLFNAPGIPAPAYDQDMNKFSRHGLYASSADPTLQQTKMRNAVGATLTDPLGATFGQVYFGTPAPFFVVWNDQFYNHPLRPGGAPWGHSKGMLAWDESGAGFVLQVSTPSWPGAANVANPRKDDGNTLGWVQDDDIEASQHFFALKLDDHDVMNVLAALRNSSVLTDPTNPQLVNNGGPAPLRNLVELLGKQQDTTEVLNLELSSGVRLISKPSALNVPPWQLVSAELGGVDLRVASWWATPKMPSTTTKSAPPLCWGDPKLSKGPGAVDIATSGTWPSTASAPNLDLRGGPKQNHAKFGVSTSAGTTLSIFGDENQQGTLGGPEGVLGAPRPCHSSQNGRGGLFYAVDDKQLWSQVTALLKGESAPTAEAAKKLSARSSGISGSGRTDLR